MTNTNQKSRHTCKRTPIKLFFFFIIFISVFHSVQAAESWTLAFYLADGENFYKEQQENVKEICGSKNQKNVNIIFFHDRKRNSTDKSSLKDTAYVSDCKKFINIPELSDDSYNTDTLRKFFSYVKTNFKTDRYFYSITAHGVPPYMKNKGSLNASDISDALRGIEPDVLGLDMCYMGSIESLLVLNKTAGYIVSASTTLPAAGNDYRTFTEYFAKHSSVTPNNAARAYLNGYKQYYKGSSEPLTVFITTTGNELNRTAGLFYERLKNLSGKLRNNLPENAVTLFGLNGDFTDLLKLLNIDYSNVFTEIYTTNASLEGVSIYFPVRWRLLDDTAYGYRLFLSNNKMNRSWIEHMVK